MAQDDSAADDRASGSLLQERSSIGGACEIHLEEITDLSPTESFLIYRRRSGLSQEETADLCGVHRTAYHRLERGGPSRLKIDIPPLGLLSEAEKCFILRKRSGKTQRECAIEMEISSYWFSKMERGEVSPVPLMKFWSRNAG